MYSTKIICQYSHFVHDRTEPRRLYYIQSHGGQHSNEFCIGTETDEPAKKVSFTTGEKHTPVLCKDHLLTAADGESHTICGTIAIAIMDEIEKPLVFNDRFTVSD